MAFSTGTIGGGLGLFGSSAIPAATQMTQPVVHQQSTLQDMLQEVTTLSAAVAGPELYGDERDGVVAMLNKLLASIGVGHGYYRTDKPPFQFNINNVFHRLKGVGYNRLSRHKNSEGLVSLILKHPISNFESPQQKQQAIDTVNQILQPKPSAPLLMSSQPKQAMNIRAEIKSTIALADQLTEFVITARDFEKHRLLSATEFYNELMQQERFNQLKQNMLCEKVVPHAEPDKSELENYLRQPPPGFEELWPLAIKNNPNPDHLIPYPIQGFHQLLQRKMIQNSVVSANAKAAQSLVGRISVCEGEILNGHNKYVKCIQKQKLLSYRLLRILANQTLIQRYGMAIDDKEEKLQCQLERINVQINAPDKIKEQLVQLFTVLRRDGDSLRRAAQDRQMNSILKTFDSKELGRCLATRQNLLEELAKSIKSSEETLHIIERAHN